MARLKNRTGRTPRHRIAIVDDDESIVASMTRLLKNEGHEVVSAADPASAVELIENERPHLVLLDYHMPGGTGADVVERIRPFDSVVQILLVTGYASEQPGRKLLAELDIQGYHDKADGPRRLLVLIDAALKHYRVLSRMHRQTASLAHVLEVSPDIMALQPQRQLLQRSLMHLGPLLAGGDGFVATANNGLFVFDEACEGISVHAATGQFAPASPLSTLGDDLIEVVRSGLEQTQPHWDPRGYVVVPLATRDDDRGCMVIEAPALPQEAVEVCQIYAKLVIQALENVLLFERATVDALTRLHNRGFGMQRLEETLQLATRTGDDTSLMMIDLDHFKTVNDTHGHAAGDLMLRAVAKTVFETCRATDIVVRYGGEELFAVLPATDLDGAQFLAERVRAAIKALRIPFEGTTLKITASLGIAHATPTRPFDGAGLLRRADQALYRAKREGRDRVVRGPLCPERSSQEKHGREVA